MKFTSIFAVIPALFFLTLLAPPIEAQYEGLPSEQNRPIVSRFRDLLSVNVPMFYDMVKQGNSMGINVLQGLVQVERGNEASRNGLEGPRPLSVRVFGVPVYERGFRFREASPVAPQYPASEAGEADAGQPNE